MESRTLVNQWFESWQKADLEHLPITENFTHTSPYGTIKGKSAYLEIVASNKEKFLGHRFNIQDAFFGSEHACTRYTAIKGDFRLEVSEWYYIENGKIREIIAYYNIEGNISEERKLDMPE